MPHRPADRGIPTLTQQAEPTLSPRAPLPDVPLLTEAAEPDQTAGAPSGSRQAPVLAARLQAEVEQAMRQALADAIEQIQARLDDTLPGIVAKVLQDVRPG